MTPKGIRRKYQGRIKRMLREVARHLRKEGLTVDGPDEMSNEDYAWGLFVTQANREPVDVRFTIAESEHWDGHPGGVNFMVEATSYEGRQIAQLIPYNYTDLVWVARDSEFDIDARFAVMMQAGHEELARLIVDDMHDQEPTDKYNEIGAVA